MIREIIEKNLPIYSAKEAQENLGDRATYIGASDIGGCPRKVVLQKFAGQNLTTENLIIFLRGHIAESIVRNSLSVSNYLWKEQVEVKHKTLPILAHIDFLIYNKDYSKILVVEVKSSNSLPDEPYGSWQQQLYLQIGLLHDQYPNAVIKGSVFAVNVNTGSYVEFDGFEYNEAIYNNLKEKGEELISLLNEINSSGEIEKATTEVSPLCAYCPFKISCPEFTGDELKLPDEIKDMIVKFKELSDEEKALSDKKNEIKNFVLDYVGQIDKFQAQFDGLKLSIYKQSSNRIDTTLLKSDYPDIYQIILKTSESLVFKVV